MNTNILWYVDDHNLEYVIRVVRNKLTQEIIILYNHRNNIRDNEGVLKKHNTLTKNENA